MPARRGRASVWVSLHFKVKPQAGSFAISKNWLSSQGATSPQVEMFSKMSKQSIQKVKSILQYTRLLFSPAMIIAVSWLYEFGLRIYCTFFTTWLADILPTPRETGVWVWSDFWLPWCNPHNLRERWPHSRLLVNRPGLCTGNWPPLSSSCVKCEHRTLFWLKICKHFCWAPEKLFTDLLRRIQEASLSHAGCELKHSWPQYLGRPLQEHKGKHSQDEASTAQDGTDRTCELKTLWGCGLNDCSSWWVSSYCFNQVELNFLLLTWLRKFATYDDSFR